MSAIQVIDGVLPALLQKELHAFFQEPIWSYGWKSNRKKIDVPNFHWNVLFAGSRNEEAATYCERELMENDLFKPIQDTWIFLKNDLLAGHELQRVYANAHTYGTDGYVHTDCIRNDGFSTICYVHEYWHHDWAGDLVFFNVQKTDIVKAVYAAPGRIVIFSGNVPHCARPLSRDCKALRMCLVFKTKKVDS